MLQAQKPIVVEQSHYLGLRSKRNHRQFCRASKMPAIHMISRTGVPNKTLQRDEVPKMDHSCLLLGYLPHANIVDTSLLQSVKRYEGFSCEHSWNSWGYQWSLKSGCHSLLELPYCHPPRYVTGHLEIRLQSWFGGPDTTSKTATATLLIF